MRALKDRFGFLFWLRWILWFAGSFAAAAVVWTQALKYVFGEVVGPELTVTWCVAVFGSWFLLVIPFMRKKEQIWKRLNQDQEKAVDLWFVGMAIFIGLLAASCLAWSFAFKNEILNEGMSHGWGKCVFGTWLAILIPFLVLMYRQADNLFKAAETRQTYQPRHRTQTVDPVQRQISPAVAAQLKAIKTTLPNGHVVTAILTDGRRVDSVFILNARELLGVYDRETLGFTASDIHSVESIPLDKLPAYEENLWLRLVD
jgi:hypothetical protein